MSEAAGIPDEIKRIQKCYALFVQKRILKTDPLYQAVKNKEMTGTEACMELLSKADLDSKTGKIKETPPSEDGVGNRILSTFNNFHQRMLSNQDLTDSTNQAATTSLFDSYEPAYQFTYSIFKPGEKFSNLVTRDFHIKAIRYSAYGSDKRREPIKNALQQGSKNIGHKTWTPDLVPHGILIGFEEDKRTNSIVADKIFLSNSIQPRENDGTVNTNKHFGSGVIGSQSYMHSIYGEPPSHYRAWSRSVISDLLCRKLPVLRTTDVNKLTREDSDFAWRQGVSCMQCHETIDPLQATIRNRMAVGTFINIPGITAPQYWFDQKITNNEILPYPESTSDQAYKEYAKRPPIGKLKFRNYEGDLIEKDIGGTKGYGNYQSLGQALQDTDDFYACGAKRYYYFLTGIDTNLEPIAYPYGFKPTPFEKKHRDHVIELGKKLRKGQNVKAILEEIIKSNTFIYPNQGL